MSSVDGIQIECTWHDGSLSCAGTATYADGNLEFQGRTPRGLRAKSFTIEDVCKAYLSPDSRAVFVWSPKQAYRFTAEGARALHDAIENDQAARVRSGETLPFDAGPGERTKHYGPAGLQSDGGSLASGVLYLTNRRVVFCPGDSRFGAVLGDEPVSVPTHELTSAEILEGLQLFRMAAGERTWTFSGPTAYELGQKVLETYPSLSQEEPPSWLDVPAGAVGAGDPSGKLMAVDGVLRLHATDGHLRTLSELKFLAKAAVHADGLNDRIHLLFDTGQWQLMVKKGWNALQALAQAWLASSPEPPEALANNHYIYQDAAVFWLDSRSFQTGWLTIGAADVVFYPSGGIEGRSEPISVAIEDVVRGDPAACQAELVQILGPGTQIVVSPSGGVASANRFWDGWERRLLSLDLAATMQNSNASELAGRCDLVRLSRAGIGLVDLTDASIIETGDDIGSLGILFPGVPDHAVDIGMPIRVEAAKPEGMYVFDTVVWWIDRAPTDLPDTLPVASFMVCVAPPKRLHRFNRRDAYRVPVEPTRTARIRSLADPVPDSIPSELIDLSVTGCRLRAPVALPLHSSVELDMDLECGQVQARGVVLNVSGGSDPNAGWKIGVRLKSLPPAAAGSITRAVMAQQRALLRERKFLRSRVT